jgi:hypothetical protein
VTILVGKDETPFILNRTWLICNACGVWAILASRLEEKNGEEMLVRLPELEARYFGVYAKWIYSSKLDTALLGHQVPTVHQAQDVPDAEKAKLENGRLVDDLMRLCTDDVFFDDVSFQTIVFCELEKWLTHRRWRSLVLLSKKTIDFVDEDLDPENPLRQLCIDWADSELTSEIDMKVLTETAPKWLLSGLLVAKMGREKGD